MAIEIISEGKKKFTIACSKKFTTACSRCGTLFSYELADLQGYSYMGRFVICPHCDMPVRHWG